MSDAAPLTLMPGDIFVDDRGTLSFINGFSFAPVKRFYIVENFDTTTIRAFHGHLKEGKYVLVTGGSLILCSVKLDNVTSPAKNAELSRVVLSARKPQIAFIPPGHANGFRALEPNTRVMFFSTSTLEESKGDDYRFPHDYWGEKIWQVENR